MSASAELTLQIKGQNSASAAIAGAKKDLQGLGDATRAVNTASAIDTNAARQAVSQRAEALGRLAQVAGGAAGEVRALQQGLGAMSGVIGMIPGPAGLAASAIAVLGAAFVVAQREAMQATATFRAALGAHADEGRKVADVLDTDAESAAKLAVEFRKLDASIRPTETQLWAAARAAEAVGKTGKEGGEALSKALQTGDAETQRLSGSMVVLDKDIRRVAEAVGLTTQAMTGQLQASEKLRLEQFRVALGNAENAYNEARKASQGFWASATDAKRRDEALREVNIAREHLDYETQSAAEVAKMRIGIADAAAKTAAEADAAKASAAAHAASAPVVERKARAHRAIARDAQAAAGAAREERDALEAQARFADYLRDQLAQGQALKLQLAQAKAGAAGEGPEGVAAQAHASELQRVAEIDAAKSKYAANSSMYANAIAIAEIGAKNRIAKIEDAAERARRERELREHQERQEKVKGYGEIGASLLDLVGMEEYAQRVRAGTMAWVAGAEALFQFSIGNYAGAASAAAAALVYAKHAIMGEGAPAAATAGAAVPGGGSGAYGGPAMTQAAAGAPTYVININGVMVGGQQQMAAYLQGAMHQAAGLGLPVPGKAV